MDIPAPSQPRRFFLRIVLNVRRGGEGYAQGGLACLAQARQNRPG